jgi:GNAT superfamily N-acetyltransferase
MELQFRRYESSDRGTCLSLFDANCPAYFAPAEREEYCAFLNELPTTYTVVNSNAVIVGAFGIRKVDSNARLNWIIVDRDCQGGGIGSAIMVEAIVQATQLGCRAIDIAASHLSAPLFAQLGAKEVRFTNHGWGPGMHRADMVLPLTGDLSR